MNLPDLSTDEQLAQALGCTPETVRAGAQVGVLPGLKFGRSWVFPREATLEALNRAARQQAEARAEVVVGKPDAVGVQPAASGRSKRPLPKLPALPGVGA